MATKELVAASTRPLLLAVLAHGDSYGYAIISEIRRLSGGALEWKDGMLYPVLRRLEAEGLVRSQWVASGVGPRRRYYSLTAKGRDALAAERSQWTEVHRTLKRAWRLAEC